MAETTFSTGLLGGYPKMISRLRLTARTINGISAILIFGAYSILCGGIDAPKAWGVLFACLIVFMPLIGFVHDAIERKFNGTMVDLLDGRLEPTPDVLESARKSILAVPWITAAMNLIIAAALILSSKWLFVLINAQTNAKFDPLVPGFASVPAIVTLTLLGVHNACQPWRTALFVGVDLNDYHSPWMLDAQKRFTFCLFLSIWIIILCAVFVMQVAHSSTPETLSGKLLSLLLSYCPVGALSLIAASAFALKPDPLEAPISRDPDATIGLHPAYEIQEQIGHGGMGVIFKARHRLWNSIVTVKMMHPNLIGSMDAINRFRMEARTVSRLNHPNVVTVIDFGVLPGGRCYMVMEYVQGAALAALIDISGPMHYAEAIPVFLQVCAALAHAHEKGILHRDLKPANVMVQGSAPPTVKLLDFGIAKMLNDPDALKLTRTGEVAGTPAYMSPEQCAGEELDLRSDIYSMGCLMYETLSGQLVFLGKSTAETMYMHITERAPELPSELEIPANLRQIVARAMEKEKNNRYQSMAELAAALNEVATADNQKHQLVDQAEPSTLSAGS
jgi:tRNA A-37 threonylcarbamoyl transferase component Bud32